jgi:signal transduction histidine kinase
VPSEWSLAAIALTTIPLVLRRKAPLLVFVWCMVCWGWFQTTLNSISLSVAGPLVALLTVSTMRPRLEAIAAAVVATLIFTFAPAPSGQVLLVTQLTIFQNVALTWAVAFGGYAFHEHNERLKAVEERAAEAERTRETEAARRVEEERVSIAREVHDITAHSLSAVSIQAAAAERLLERDPEAARAALSEIRTTSKTALDDIRAMIGVLRSGSGAETAPTQGTDRIADIVAYLEGAGIQTSLSVEGYDAKVVPAHIDVALFGIAREAATNMVRHAEATEAHIALSTYVSPDGERVAALVVEDNGCGINLAAIDGTHHGVQGMRERARLLQGTCDIEVLPRGGTSVVVKIPFGHA